MAKAKGSSGEVAQGTSLPIQLVRRNLKTGKISLRKRGRPHPDFENGYMQGDQFYLGNVPSAKRGPGRPKGSLNVRKGDSDLGKAIDTIVEKAVQDRLKQAKQVAIEAFSQALER